MPRSKPLHRYPQEYYALFERAQEGDFSLPFENAARARYLRGELYNMRARIRDALAMDPAQPELAEQYIIMENIVIEKDDNVLHFHKRRYKNAAILQTTMERQEKVVVELTSASAVGSHEIPPAAPSILDIFK